MASEWYYTINGQQGPGPISASELKQLATSGQLKPTDLVWQDGMPDWVEASTIKGLISGSRSVPAPVPAPAPAPVPEPAPLIEAPVTARPRKSSRSRPRDEVREVADDYVRDRAPSGGGLLAMNPVLVWLLSVCTCNIFGLIYVYSACSAYSEKAAQRSKDGAGRLLGKARHPIGVLLLSYLTLGFYFYYWIYQAMLECCAYTGRQDVSPRSELALMLVFPPYSVYVVIFRLPELIRAVQQQAKVSESTAVNHAYVFLNPCMFLGLPFLSMIQQDALNQVWFQAP